LGLQGIKRRSGNGTRLRQRLPFMPVLATSTSFMQRFQAQARERFAVALESRADDASFADIVTRHLHAASKEKSIPTHEITPQSSP